jgi:carotenoid cleavage dioxygenase
LSERRWTVDTASGAVADDVVEADRPGELPNRDPRKVGRANRYDYLVEVRGPSGAPDFGGVIKRDHRTGRREIWAPHAAIHSGEWLFVPTGRDEDAGYLLTFVYDDRTERSHLAVIDATDVARGPVARVALPQRVPYGFHGTWVPA